jgi:WhiB family redox-sensing transcriptional regulator
MMRTTDSSWMDQAACRGMDPSIFFADDQGRMDETEAKAVCAECPVQLECLDYSVANREDDVPSVWAGMNERERRKIRFRWVRTFPELSKSLEREINELLGLEEEELDVLGR